MTLRRRMTLTVGACVGLAVALASLVGYVAVRSELRGQVDERLSEQASFLAARGQVLAARTSRFDEVPPLPEGDVGPPAGVRVIAPSGEVVLEEGRVGPSPGDPPTEGALIDAEVGDEHVRVASAPIEGGGTVQVSRSLEDIDSTLAGLRTNLFLVVMAGAALAALAARLIADRMLAPVDSLTKTAEHVSATEDLSRRIQVTGSDEVARLASRFNSMLERLEGSRRELDSAHEEQRLLIADASHELRTPVTSLRTNIELIAGGQLAPAEADVALAASVAQTEELSDLIGDLMDLARGEAPGVEPESVRLDQVVSGAVERARRHAPEVSFTLTAESTVVVGTPDRLARAVNNLLDNAAEHANGAPVEVTVANEAVTVRDHGPGIDPGDAERIFDRFYRGRGSRRSPGAGLGLAIVQQVAESNGGSVSVENAAGGGALFRLQLSG